MTIQKRTKEQQKKPNYYKISFYSKNLCYGSQFLELWQLQHIKFIVDFYFKLKLKKINIRIEEIYIDT